jgi:outer membrane protein OmpA-like peptidoglycan-associated protein
MKRTFFLPLILLALSTALHSAGEAVKEHPLIRPFPGSIVDPHGQYSDFDEYKFWVIDEATGKKTKKAVRGKFWKLTYGLRDDAGNAVKSHSVLEYVENYRRAALEKGGKILYQEGGYMTFTLPGEDGSTTWCEVHVWNYSQQDLRIIEEAGFRKSLSFGPAEMKAALDAEGRVALHDILFDTDKATLRPESDKQLQHVLALLRDNPDLKLEVQGHTDDQGAEDYNLDLSQRRAETVAVYLKLFGVENSRLVPRGYGEAVPVAPNTTEEGRSQNRRVELVKITD